MCVDSRNDKLLLDMILKNLLPPAPNQFSPLKYKNLMFQIKRRVKKDLEKWQGATNIVFQNHEKQVDFDRLGFNVSFLIYK